MSRPLPGFRAFALIVFLSASVAVPAAAQSGPDAPGWRVLGWNDLGMHCMDSDYSVFSILPPYNTIHAQVIDPSGLLVTHPDAAGLTVTYEAVHDTAGVINTTSRQKTNFWSYVNDLFGASPPVDTGLKGNSMPGPNNTPQPMTWDAARNWFGAEGIPITPSADTYRRDSYPMLRLAVRDRNGALLATTDIVVPVSDEMDCSTCHLSGSDAAARPAAGWFFLASRDGDQRFNILRLHDEKQKNNAAYGPALASFGYDARGLVATVNGGRAVLCSNCHASNALGTGGAAGVPPLTRSMHGAHAGVIDPTNGQTLDSATNRSACYRCHPGAVTQCLRDPMGMAVDAATGERSMQCQNCHGNMSQVGAPSRAGWFDEPACQECHTGTATHNNGQIRYTSVFDAGGLPRQAVDATFATNPDTPAPGKSLFRFSQGHGSLLCSDCHGSPHAIFPTPDANDNVQSEKVQGHKGTLVECTGCHAADPVTVNGGPHGMHPVGQGWVATHGDVAGPGCQACHGADSHGTVLSRSQADRTISTPFGVKVFWRGFQVSCYACHLGPNNEAGNPNRAPLAQSTGRATGFGVSANVTLTATDADANPLTYRIVGQPAHGRVGLVGRLAKYLPDKGFSGTDTFTYAAWDGQTNSNLATVTMTVLVPDAPPPVPDGRVIAGKELDFRRVPDGSFRLGWDVADCPAPGYHAVWLDLTSLATYRVVGESCAVGTTGEWIGMPPGGAIAALVVSDNTATVEGTYGQDAAGQERPAHSPACGLTSKRTDGGCP